VAPFGVDLFRQPLKEIRELTEDDTNVVQPDIIKKGDLYMESGIREYCSV